MLIHLGGALYHYLNFNWAYFNKLDGVSIAPKDVNNWTALKNILQNDRYNICISVMKSNRLMVFGNQKANFEKFRKDIDLSYFKIIEVNINKHRPIKVINNQSIEIIELYLKDYSFILDISTKQNLCFGSYVYYKIVQVSPEYSRYKVLVVSDNEISIRYWSIIEDSEAYPCSEEEFDTIYNKVISGSLANKVIY